MVRRAATALLAVALPALAVTGCGAQQSKPYTAAGTVACIRDKGFTKVTTAAAKVGFIAGFAENGGLRAEAKSGNVLTIAFTADASAVPGTKRAFTRAAAPQYKNHMADIMESKGNAVLVWTVTPAQQDLDDALGCLHS
jgi:hypothetical protein